MRLLQLEDTADGLLRLENALRVGHARAGDVDGGLQLAEDLADVERVARHGRIAPEGRRRRLFALQGRGAHLPARHAVEGVVDEDAREVFAARGRLEGVVEANRAKVAVALVGDRDGVRTRPARAGRDGGGAAVGGGDVRRVPVVVGEHAAADGIDEDRLVLQPHLGAAFGDELVHDAVPAAGAVVGDARLLPAARKLRIHALLFNDFH